jgi:multiple sugar transport system substrate-binding protein
MRGLRLITLAAIPVLVLSACSSTAATTAPSVAASAPASSAVASTPVTPGVTVRWFVGLGGGTQPSQIDAQKKMVADYNANNADKITIKLEIVPNANATDVLKTEIAAGNGPDIIGPVGVKGRNGFEGLFLDLTSQIAANSYDMTRFDPALTNFFKEGQDGQIGIPYVIYPGYIWYNKDLFTKAGLAPLPKTSAEQYNGAAWDWDNLAKTAAQLTLDKSGKNSTQAGFDAKSIVKYGMDFQWTGDMRRFASCFGPGNFVAADGKTAQIPPVWAEALNWYYKAVWTDHIIPTGAVEASTLLGTGNSQSSGNIAMNAAWGWSISSIASDAATAKVKLWDMAVMPSYKGVTTSPMDADTFTITKSTKNPAAAFKAMTAILADKTLASVYGGEPADKTVQAAYFADFDTTLGKIFPGIKVTWSVLGEMAKVPAIPSHEANMPAVTKSNNDANALWTKMQSGAGLDLTKELETLQKTLQTDFDNAKSILVQ